MRIKEGFMLRKLGNQYVVVALGEAGEGFHGIIRLNGTGASLWEYLQKGDRTEEELVSFITDSYEIDQETAGNDVHTFVEKLKTARLLEQ